MDILFLSWNRLAYTRESLLTLFWNTNWAMVDRLILWDDGSSDGTYGLVRSFAEDLQKLRIVVQRFTTELGGPVAVMNDYLTGVGADVDLFVKVDNDVLLPPYWLDVLLGLAQRYPAIDLIGIEAMSYPPQPAYPDMDCPRTLASARHIGGIGAMRREAFRGRPQMIPSGVAGRFGFTGWQHEQEEVQKAWIEPPLPVCLLDRLPLSPWKELGDSYVNRGWQRSWPLYDAEKMRLLWDWWRPSVLGSAEV